MARSGFVRPRNLGPCFCLGRPEAKVYKQAYGVVTYVELCKSPREKDLGRRAKPGDVVSSAMN